MQIIVQIYWNSFW